ncbi:MAG: MalT-like region [Thermoanaerobaculia bacterium]|jgi:tetratricopeptide (TPR) repeat protein|nr:MalT-like region [Thermoanaerobaculia bacterium]
MKHADDVEHLAECATCRQRFAGTIPFQTGERLARKREFAAAAMRLDRERGDASDVVARVLRETPVAEWPRLADRPALRNNAALEQLSDEVRKRLHRCPTEALAIAKLATGVAELIPSGIYPPLVLAQMRANAWKDRASALRYLARYDEALNAVAIGEQHLAPFAAVEHDRAIVRMVKGMVFLQTSRFDEARPILAECRRVFAEHHDSRRHAHAGIAEGSVLYEMSRYGEAQDIFTGVLDDAIATGDIESQARVHNNLGYCLTHLGDYARANIHFSEAIAKFTDLGFFAEVPRTERGAARVLIGRGQADAGLAYLRAARRDFGSAGLIEEAGFCALSIAALLVECGESAEARALTQNVIDEFTAARLDERAIAAVIRLRDDIDADGATAETVRTVHAFVESLRDEVCGVAN